MLFDYSSLTAERMAEIADGAVAQAEATVDRAVASSPLATLADTLLPFDEVADIIAGAMGRVAFMGKVHPDPAIRAAARHAEEQLETWKVGLLFRPEVDRAVHAFAATDEASALTGEPRRLLDFLLRDLRKAGHGLADDVQAEVQQARTRLVELAVRFGENVEEYEDHLEVTRADLDGLPDDYAERLAAGPGPDTFRVSMDYPDVIPFFENATRRDLREQLAFKFGNRAVDANRPLLEEAVRLRHRVAQLFGQPSWAHHQMDDHMAKDPESVQAFYDDLMPPLVDKARAEIAAMAEFLADDTGDGELQVWDWRYYDTQLRKRDFGLDPHEVAAYFPMQPVLDGLLDLTGEVFGLDYRRVDDAPTWHPDVVCYAIHDRESGEPVAHFYMDLHPRPSKYGHAAAFDLMVGRRRPDGSYQQPVAAIVANFTKPTADAPSLLQHDEVVTLFHEFGHVLHQTLTRAELVRFSGTNTEVDFVEAPSQIMEHWCWNASVLTRFARHHRTGEPIPEALVEQLVAARGLNVGVTTLRQMQFGVLDLLLHGPGEDKDLDDIHRRAVAVSLLPFHEGTFFPASFEHMVGGYDAGYYGYLWSEVFGDDMFSRFEAEGVTNPDVGRSYRREILERGGSLDGDVMLRNFLGRPPDNRAFLRKLGIDDQARAAVGDDRSVAR